LRQFASVAESLGSIREGFPQLYNDCWEWSDCEKRIHKAEENLHKEVRKHGERTRQAENRSGNLIKLETVAADLSPTAAVITTATIIAIVTAVTRLDIVSVFEGFG
jgi:hypothetical protein